MSNKFPSKWLKRYPALADISPAEWHDFFPNARAKWTEEEEEYVGEWYGYDHILSLSYALGRLPWAVYERAAKLGLTKDRQRHAG